jgi:glycosyltransferase involved in cell wall biosynthesis
MICSVQDRPLWESIQARAAKMANVEFLERVPYRDIQSHFNASRIFVNTSDHEGVPNTFIHSGLGRTAIASLVVNPDGMFDVFGAGICAGGDLEKLAGAIAGWMSDETALRKAQDECARFVREWHDNTHNVNTFLAGL